MTTSAKRLSASLAALLVVGLLAPTLAGATWTAPVDLSAAGQNAGSPQVAVDADGDAVFVWTRTDGTNFRVQTRARSAAGVLSSVQTLSQPGQNAILPQVAVDADGDAVFTWVYSDGGTSDRVQARARSAGGALSAVRNLSPSGQPASSPQVAVDADGDAVFVWTRSDGTNSRIQTRARSGATSALSAVQTLSAGGKDAITPQVAVDADGDATFTWVRSDATDTARVQTRARSAGGALSFVQTVSAPGQSAFDPQVAVDADGDAVFTWRRFDVAGNARIEAGARSAGGVLSAVQTLSQPGQSAFFPQVAVDADGDAVFTWQRSDGASVRVQARARSADGVLSDLQSLSASLQSARDPQVEVDADGDAVFTWRITDGADTLIQARTRSGAGALSAAETLSAPGPNAFDPQVGVDADGDAVVTWLRSDGTNTRIQASAGP